MKTIRLTMGQALLKFLDNQFIEMDGIENKFVNGIFAIFGHGNVVGFGEALEKYKGDIVLYQGRNEQGMAHGAIGYAKQNNRKKIIACTSSIGPGALNMVTAAGTATVNRIPLLLFPGDSFACRQPDPVLQQIEISSSMSITSNDAFKAVSKYWDRVVRPEQLMSAMINAMRVLTDPAETGAVTICLPQDTEGEAYDYPIEFFKKRIHYITRRIPDLYEINRAIEIIKNKKKPLLICGGGVTYSDAGEILMKFAEKFNIPFGETQAGKGFAPWNHPLNLGGIGVTGTEAANKIVEEADLVIAVGTRLSDFTTSSKGAFKNNDFDLITLNVNSFDGYKMDANMILADAKEGLNKLYEGLNEINYKSKYEDEIRIAKEKWDKEVDRLFNINLEEGLSQTRVLGELNKLLKDEDIIVGSSGSLPGDLQRIWRTTNKKTYHMEYGFSCMGYEICAALGVKMASEENEVYSMVGDGSFMMLHSELATSIQEGKKINILLFDNYGFQCIHNLQNGNGIPTFGTEFRYRDEKTNRHEGEYIKTDFAKIAEGYGAKGYRVTNIEELRNAIASAQKDKISTLIDIKVLPRTMTGGYNSWWRVGVPEISESESVNKSYENMKKEIENTKKY